MNRLNGLDLRFAPRYMYSREEYPNYLSGSGYVFTIGAAKKLYNASMEMPLLYLEDVYTTGNLMVKFLKNPHLNQLFLLKAFVQKKPQ